MEKLAYQVGLHKPIKRKFQRRRVYVKGIDYIWAADLVEMQEWSKQNKGFRYLLNVIDIFSKFAWSIPLKIKMGNICLDVFKLILKKFRRKPKFICTDKGISFIVNI